jgi:hypothetical protein
VEFARNAAMAHTVRVRLRRRPRVFTRPHRAVTERGNFHFLGIFGVFRRGYF